MNHVGPKKLSRTIADQARGKQRGFSPTAAAHHSQSARAHTDVCYKHFFAIFPVLAFSHLSFPFSCELLRAQSGKN